MFFSSIHFSFHPASSISSLLLSHLFLYALRLHAWLLWKTCRIGPERFVGFKSSIKLSKYFPENEKNRILNKMSKMIIEETPPPSPSKLKKTVKPNSLIAFSHVHKDTKKQERLVRESTVQTGDTVNKNGKRTLSKRLEAEGANDIEFYCLRHVFLPSPERLPTETDVKDMRDEYQWKATKGFFSIKFMLNREPWNVDTVSNGLIVKKSSGETLSADLIKFKHWFTLVLTKKQRDAYRQSCRRDVEVEYVIQGLNRIRERVIQLHRDLRLEKLRVAELECKNKHLCVCLRKKDEELKDDEALRKQLHEKNN